MVVIIVDLTKGVDFITPQKSGAVITATYGQDRIDYLVTLDTAKHICMIERNDENTNPIIDIVKSKIGDEEVNSVNLRDVHAYLEVGKDFSAWAKDKLDGFQEGEDFLILQVFPKNGENLKGGRPSKEYVVTVDVAKEICMLQKNAKGRELRKYFIDCEKKLHATPQLPDFNDPVASARAWADAKEAEQKALALNREQAKQLAEAQPHVERSERFMAHGKAISIGEFAKVYNYKGLGQNKLFALLRENHILMNGSRRNQPFQKHVEAGRFRVITGTTVDGYTYTKTLVTPIGFDWLVKFLDKLFEI